MYYVALELIGTAPAYVVSAEELECEAWRWMDNYEAGVVDSDDNPILGVVAGPYSDRNLVEGLVEGLNEPTRPSDYPPDVWFYLQTWRFGDGDILAQAWTRRDVIDWDECGLCSGRTHPARPCNCTSVDEPSWGEEGVW